MRALKQNHLTWPLACELNMPRPSFLTPLLALLLNAAVLPSMAAETPPNSTTAASADIGDIMGRDRPLAITRQSQPIYPKEAQAAGIMGTVKVEIYVGADGAVGDIKILSSPHELLSKAVIDAARKSRFRPMVKNGRTVGTTMQQQFSFHDKPL